MIRIAICDDSVSDRRRLRKQIEEKGKSYDIQMQEFSSGEELLEALQYAQFSGVFLDIQMQGIYGEEAARRIRERDSGLVLAKGVLFYVQENERILLK